jgi:ferredoxin
MGSRSAPLPPTPLRLRVRVDGSRCQGHNRCRALVPALFEVDDYGQATVVGDGSVPAELEGRVRLAVANCPELAITLEND